MKRAILVGINHYQNISNLAGCVNDVKNMADVLVNQLGYSSDQILPILNENATQEKIFDALRWGVRVTEPGDRLFFHFSGHGSQVKDMDADENDIKDEILCPHNMNWEAKTYIRDDDLRHLFGRLHDDALLEVVLDSCHSGTGIRADDGRIDRYEHPPFEWFPAAGARRRSLREPITERPNHVLWAACQDGQASQEAWINGCFRAVFTHSWCQEVRNNPRAGRFKVITNIRSYLRASGYKQVPQLEIG